MSYTNEDVLRWWARGWKATSVHLFTKGGELYSYGHRIGVTVSDKRYIWRVVEPVISSTSQRTAMRRHFNAASRTQSIAPDTSMPLEIPQAADPYEYIRNLTSGELYSSMTDEELSKTLSAVASERFTYGKELDELTSQVLVRSLNDGERR